jgi:hypothetical protein
MASSNSGSAALKVATILGFILLGLSYILGFGPGAGALASACRAWAAWRRWAGARRRRSAGGDLLDDGQRGGDHRRGGNRRSGAQRCARGRTVSLRILLFYLGSIGVIVAIVPWDKVVPGFSPFTSAMQAVHVPGRRRFHDGGGVHRGALLPQFGDLSPRGCCSKWPGAATPGADR